MAKAKLSVLLFCFGLYLRVADGTFDPNPGTIYVHENEDIEKDLLEFTAKCKVRWTSYYSKYVSWTDSDGDTHYGYEKKSKKNSGTFDCNTCSYSGNERFYVTGKKLRKRKCVDSGCGPTCSAAYCNNAGETYSVTITCYSTGYDLSSGSNSMEVSIRITQNAAPTFHWQHGTPLKVYSSTSGIVNSVVASDSDSYIDNDSIYYRLQSGVDPSYVFGRTLFTFDTSTGNVLVNSDLTVEFSNYYYMTVCVGDRRKDETCETLNITLHACFQTPNCSDQTNTISDTYGTYTGHGTPTNAPTNTLYTMIYPQPDDHFPTFHNGWHQLNWVFIRNDFETLRDPPIAIDLKTGEIFVTKNISIFPSWPHQDFVMIVQVSNPSASCYTTTCTFQTRVLYTNWPIEILSLPNTTSLHEDTDEEILIHNLTLFDYNYHWEDNFTCVMDPMTSDTGVNMANMFQVRQISGNDYNHDSWGIYKLKCNKTGCGYLDANFLCEEDKGCMNHNRTQEYYIQVTCKDGYGSSDTEILTFRPIQNRAPYFTNLPKTITLKADEVASLDIVYSITYWDEEEENLFYRYTYTEDSTSQDPGFWLGTTWGNYYNSLGNISSTIHLWNTTNSTFTLYICGHERRNDICGYLYIKVEEHCGPVPTCTEISVNEINEIAVGKELFDLSTLVSPPSNGGSYGGLSYAIAHSGNYFEVNELTGIVTLSRALPAVFPSKSYSISSYVYDRSACEYSTCTNIVIVTAVNNEISIINLEATVSIHEDTTRETSVYTIATSDPDADDSVSCTITSIVPDESEPDHFKLVETFSGSEVYEVHTKRYPGFTEATQQYLVTIECADSHSSTDSGVLTVVIDLNQPPTLTNLANPTSTTIDPAAVVSGDIVYTVSTSDTENDAITFDCTVANTEVPFECSSTNIVTYIRLRRNLGIVTDNGKVYSITVCISDAKHASAACGSLQATVTSTKTYPYISNLPHVVSIPENTSAGFPLFDLEFVDPDPGETHTFILHSVGPAGSTGMFSLVASTGVVATADTFDFESQSQYRLEFLVADNTLTATSTKYLTVNITDVNEAPILGASRTYVNLTESILPGTEILFYFSVTDPDLNDTHTFSISSGTYASSFTIDSQLGVLTMGRSWDRENGDPPSVSLGITCTDSGGLSDTTQVVMDFANVNDNQPTFTVSGSTSDIQISSETSLITNLLTVSCSDLDVGDDGTCEFTILGAGVGSQYFTMESSSKRAVGSSAYLRLISPLSFDYNTSFTFTIQVSDGSDSDALFVGIPVSITYTAPAATPLTRPSACTTCTSQGKVLIGFICLEGVIVVVIVTHLIWHFCCRADPAKNRRKRSDTVRFNKTRVKPINIQPSVQPRPSTSKQPDILDPRANSSKRPLSNKSTTSGLYTKSTLAVRRSRGVNTTRVDSDCSSSSDSWDSSDGEVTLPPRFNERKPKPPTKRNPNVVVHGQVNPNRTSRGLPDPVYR